MSFSALRSALLAAAVTMASAGSAWAWCVRGVEGWDTLRIRTGPSAQAREVGGIPANACGIAIVGGCRGTWCPVAWRGRTGWSNAVYLSQGGPIALLAPPSWAMRPPPRVARPLPPPASRVARPAPGRVAAAPSRPRAVEPRSQREAARAPSPPPAPAPQAPPPVERQAAPPPMPPAPAPPPATAGAAVVVPPAAAPTPSPQTELCVTDVAKGDTLKVRAGPGLDQQLRFGFPAEVCGVRITGACKDGWCPVEYRGYRGWAERRFLK